MVGHQLPKLRTRVRFPSLAFFSCVFLAGCATVTSLPRLPREDVSPRTGLYHRVRDGETIWRLAKAYGVSERDILAANQIPDGSKIEKGRLIFIPGATRARDIVVDTPRTRERFVWPVQGKILRRFRQYYRGRRNLGIDIGVQEGTLVRAARTGRVVLSDYVPGYGYTVILDHANDVYSVYAHNARLLVKTGQLVLKNTEIARVGRSTDGAYLHFQIHRRGVFDNPLRYLP